MRKNLCLACLLLAMLILFSSCGAFVPADEYEYNKQAAIVLKPVEIKAAATATPEPVIVIRDPVKGHSPMRIEKDVPEMVTIPSIYQAIDLEGVNHAVYAYTNTEGKTEYRVYAEVDELEDENVMNTLKGFFEAKIHWTDGSYFVETNKEDNPIDVSTEKPATFTPCEPPVRNTIRSQIRTRENEARKYEREVESAQAKGEPLPEPTPWDGLPIYTDETEPIEIPSKVRALKKVGVGMYYYVDIYGDEVFRRYATPNGTDSGFYLSDEQGNIQPGALMLDHNKDFAKENFKGRKAEERPADNIYRSAVKILLTSGEEQIVDMVYTKKNEPEA